MKESQPLSLQGCRVRKLTPYCWACWCRERVEQEAQKACRSEAAHVQRSARLSEISNHLGFNPITGEMRDTRPARSGPPRPGARLAGGPNNEAARSAYSCTTGAPVLMIRIKHHIAGRVAALTTRWLAPFTPARLCLSVASSTPSKRIMRNQSS